MDDLGPRPPKLTDAEADSVVDPVVDPVVDVQVADDESDVGERFGGPGRLFALCDGVFAISMTLLAIDVKIPDGVPNTVSGFTDASHSFYGKFGVFLAAFLIAGRFWLVNHQVMTPLKRVDHGVLERSILFLAGICSLPVATTLLFRDDAGPQPVAFASVLLATTSLLSGRLWWYVTDPKRNLSDNVGRRKRTQTFISSLSTSALFLLATPIAYLLPAGQTHWALMIWIALLFDNRFARLVARLRLDRRRAH